MRASRMSLNEELIVYVLHVLFQEQRTVIIDAYKIKGTFLEREKQAQK